MQKNVLPILIAILISQAVAIGVLVYTPLSIEAQKKQPPGKQLGDKGNGDQSAGKPSSETSSLRIDCDPNCSAQSPDQERNQGYITRILDKLLSDPIAMLTGILAVTSILLVLDGRKVAARQTRETKRQLVLTEKAFVVTNRPWVSILHPLIASPLSWEETGARMTINVTVKNVRSSPAFDVTIEAHQFIMGPSRHDIGAAVVEFCENVKKRQIARAASNQSGDVLFPNEDLPVQVGLFFGREEVEASAKSMGISFFSPIVIVCADYRSSVTNSSHTVGLAYFLLKLPEVAGGLPKMLTPDQTLNPNACGLARAPFGSFAN